MPELCRFYGIIIAMYYRDHSPPHFHAIYGEHEATVEIANGEVLGSLLARALRHVQDWRMLHVSDLQDAWSLAQDRRPLLNLAPLE